MEPDPAQLAALVAIAELGSFEAAARELHVTASAISQRIRALERTAGQVLVSRGTPCRPTPAGEPLVRLGRQLRLVYDEARRELTTGVPVDVRVAVNADSLATWFRGVLAAAATWELSALQLRVEDQAWSQGLLRSGEVLAAVTSDPEPVQGCTVEPLGAMRYVAVAVPALAAVPWARRPMVVFNEKDRLQHDLLERRGTSAPAVVHRVPTSADFAEAVRLGLGWALLPEAQAAPGLASGELVRLGREHVDVPLHWQRWRLDSELLGRVTEAVRSAARTGLRAVAGRSPSG
ncbi:LysR family transcriptional regulator ArgP [Nocardioides sp. CER19]|uniref:LysR family transcriptional regulator ArgP n=1 Tax=Nocardioides sp. CER19 TaxID=3038538 RepID=UPI00244CBDCA|nr:LysR family transcriptional regulator ArgP [Nocardioides sp. CER19]MDH2413642.1 LysR family transcriptional regulator ArgP [Nocardioides sp. CER19]